MAISTIVRLLGLVVLIFGVFALVGGSLLWGIVLIVVGLVLLGGLL